LDRLIAFVKHRSCAKDLHLTEASCDDRIISTRREIRWWMAGRTALTALIRSPRVCSPKFPT
jgi:hypothetical protein